MLKVRVFLNQPLGKTWAHFSEMIPGLGGKYKSVVEIETISKPRQGFRDIEYMKLGLPMAPAVMVGDEIIVQGCEAAEEKVEEAIRRQLNLAEPLPKKL